MSANQPRKSEVWLINIPDGEGSEQKGKRPAIIASNEPSLEMSMIIPLTSNINAERFPHTYKLMASKQNGLYSASIALVFQLRAIDNSRLEHQLGNLEQKEQYSIDALVKDMLKV